jgi:hypothetical protein
MLRLSTLDWLSAWEDCQQLAEPLKPCALLALIVPGGFEAASCLAIGQRDACLLDLYAALFGSQLPAVLLCAHCQAELDLNLSTTDLRLAQPGDGDRLEREYQDYRVEVRLPNSQDLAHIAHSADLAVAREQLLQRCVRVRTASGDIIPASELPASVIDDTLATMAEADPQALTELSCRCPACGSMLVESFDIGRYLVQRMQHWSERVLDQVHVLARAYGWTELEVLQLSPTRRARYIERVLS